MTHEEAKRLIALAVSCERERCYRVVLKNSKRLTPRLRKILKGIIR